MSQLKPLNLNPSPTQQKARCGEKDFGKVVFDYFVLQQRTCFDS
jgi:hypothetical protein